MSYAETPEEFHLRLGDEGANRDGATRENQLLSERARQARERSWCSYLMVAIGYEWNHVAKFCNYPSGRAAMLSVS